MLCQVTSAARLYQPVAAFQQMNAVASGWQQSQAAIQSGDYQAAAVAMSRVAFNVPALYGSLRESFRFGKALASLDAQRISNYLSACFAAGTPIRWEHGSKAVEFFKPGERVWARNEHDSNAPVELKEIEEVFVNYAPIWHLHVGGQLIRTTAEHPFYVLKKGWRETQELEIGDLLLGGNGEVRTVEDILPTGESETVYNFRVADHHLTSSDLRSGVSHCGLTISALAQCPVGI